MFNRDGTSDLSFVRDKKFWIVERTGDYSTDFEAGRNYALELQRHMFFGSVAGLLASVARAIVECGDFGAVEAGFFQQIGEDLIRTPNAGV